MTILKIIAIISNIILIGFWLFLVVIEEALEYSTGWEIFMLWVLFLTPIINIIALTLTSGDNWISLYFKRRALEEKKKIAKIEEELK